jgi:hypothetical protein
LSADRVRPIADQCRCWCNSRHDVAGEQDAGVAEAGPAGVRADVCGGRAEVFVRIGTGPAGARGPVPAGNACSRGANHPRWRATVPCTTMASPSASPCPPSSSLPTSSSTLHRGIRRRCGLRPVAFFGRRPPQHLADGRNWCSSHDRWNAPLGGQSGAATLGDLLGQEVHGWSTCSACGPSPRTGASCSAVSRRSC